MIQSVAIIGAGAMGKGIAQISAQAGFRTLIFDIDPTHAESAKSDLCSLWEKLSLKGKLTPAEVAAARGNLIVARSLSELKDADLVVEAIVESLDSKRSLFLELEKIVSTNCILATNTSSLSVTAIARPLKSPDRVAGLHFFNPVPLMRVAEVITAVATRDSVTATLTDFVSKLGHKPVLAKDSPGFIVNHAGRGYGTEALKLLGEAVADIGSIDKILRDAYGFRMGPFELLDLTGLDVSHPVMESIYEQFYQEPRYRPSYITKQRLDAGYLGRKSGQGFYKYESGSDGVIRKIEPTSPTSSFFEESSLKTTKVWVGPAASESFESHRQKLIALLKGVTAFEVVSTAAEASVCVVVPIGSDVSGECARWDLDPKRTVGVDILLPDSLARYLTVMTNPLTDIKTVKEFLAAMGRSPDYVSVISDSAGFVGQRVLAAIINIACDIAQQNLASPEDIDVAVVLGLGYPKGPLQWGDAIGADKLLLLLSNLHESFQDPRYRPSPWLKRRAQLKCSLKHREACRV